LSKLVASSSSLSFTSTQNNPIVKKFYFRISKFPDDNNLYNNEVFIEYLKVTNLIKNEDYINVSRKFNDKFVDFINSTN